MVEDKERFMERVFPEPNSGCWLWLGSCSKKGYGRFWYRKHRWSAHRVSFTLFRCEIPKGLHVLHRCDTPSCTNPDHLFLGTNTDNIADRVKKKRTKIGDQRGEKNNNAKLTPSDIAIIRSIKNIPNEKIALMFDMERRAIDRIVSYRTWKHLP